MTPSQRRRQAMLAKLAAVAALAVILFTPQFEFGSLDQPVTVAFASVAEPQDS